MLNNIIYIGHMAQLRWTSLSYKNHKRFRNDESEWAIVYNTHEPIISQELWNRCQERKKSVAKGRRTKVGYTHPLSGFLIKNNPFCHFPYIAQHDFFQDTRRDEM